MEKMMNKKTEGNTFTKKIGQTVYVVRYHFNEDAKETMQEKINRMLVAEASRIWVAVGYVIGKNLSDTLGGLIGLAIGGLIGCYIQKNHSKKDD